MQVTPIAIHGIMSTKPAIKKGKDEWPPPRSSVIVDTGGRIALVV